MALRQSPSVVYIYSMCCFCNFTACVKGKYYATSHNVRYRTLAWRTGPPCDALLHNESRSVVTVHDLATVIGPRVRLSLVFRYCPWYCPHAAGGRAPIRSSDGPLRSPDHPRLCQNSANQPTSGHSAPLWCQHRTQPPVQLGTTQQCPQGGRNAATWSPPHLPS